MSGLPASAVIRAHPDGYDMAQPRLMGRQAAGHGFLRAAVQARAGRPIVGLSPSTKAANAFHEIVKSIDPEAPFTWIQNSDLRKVGDTGVLYLADSTVAAHARQRLRAGVGAFSLCGVTHTTASENSMTQIVGLLREPVMPWDALVCTSSAVLETVRRVHEAEADYLRWRFGPNVAIPDPRLPVIPLGVHCDDFVFSDTQRAEGRRALGIEDDEVVSLFIGRLVYHAKAHPFAMYRGLQQAAERTGKRLTLILCGWAPNEGVAEVFQTGAAQFAPDVRVLFVEGRDPVLRGHAWAGSDIFLSLSDNIQETFGLTPIEGMAAGLPVVVTDWNGYKDTVRQGIDGFRVTTWSPEGGMGQPLASGYEDLSVSYDRYCWAAAAVTGVDLGELTDALSFLVANPAVRRTMGDAGRRRARELYDWPVVYRQYEALWDELNARRRAAAADPDWIARAAAAPKAGSANLDPFEAFGHYPTHHIGAATPVTLDPDVTAAEYALRADHGLFAGVPTSRPLLNTIHAAIQAGAPNAAAISDRTGQSLPNVVRALGLMLKMGLARLG